MDANTKKVLLCKAKSVQNNILHKNCSHFALRDRSLAFPRAVTGQSQVSSTDGLRPE